MAIKKKIVEIDTSEAQVSVKQLRQLLKDLKDVMASSTEGTDEYNAALRQAAEIQHQLAELTRLVNNSAADFGQIVSNSTKLLGGMIAGFLSAKSIMNMFGVENETVIKSLQQMQNLMALTQALPALDNAVKGFQNLRTVIQTATGATGKFGKALVSTGLGALVVALGYIVSHFEEISKWLDEITGQTDFLGTVSDAVMGGLNAAWAGLVQSIKAVGNAIITYVTSPFKSIVAAIRAFSDTTGSFGDKLKAAGAAMKDNFVDQWQDVGSSFKKIGEVSADAYQEGFEKNRQKRMAKNAEELSKSAKAEMDALLKALTGLYDEINLYNKSAEEKELLEISKKENEKLEIVKKSLEKRLITQQEAEKQMSAITENYEKQRLAVRDKYAKLAEESSIKSEQDRIASLLKENVSDLERNYKYQLALLQKNLDEELITQSEYDARKKEITTAYVQDYIDSIQYIFDTEKNLTDAQILELTEKINGARALLKSKDETSDTSEGLTANQISEAINASALALNEFSDNPAWGNILKNIAVLAANWDKLNLLIKAGGEKAFGAYALIAATALSGVAQMMNGLAAEQDQSNKEGFESAKKFLIAGATMSMLAGITSAWASSMQLGPIAGPIAGAILSAMMLATGIAQISKIKSQLFGGGSSSASSGTPNTGAISSINAPVQYTQDVQGANIEETLKDTKVYVTEGDITSTQKKVDVTESEALF